MTQAALVKLLATHGRMTGKDAQAALQALLNGIVHATRKDGRVALADFGVFYLKRHRARRIAGPPGIGGEMRLPAQETIGFRASTTLRRRKHDAARRTKRDS